MKAAKHDKNSAPDALPLKAVLDELTFVRKAFHDISAHYVAEVESEIAVIREAVATAATRKKIPASCARGLRDLLLLLRGLDVKPEKGRRRDLKKIEALVEEMQHIVDAWD